MRRICILAVALTSLAIADSAAAAPAVPVPLSFNNAVLTTPGFKDVVLVSPKTQPITATAKFDPATGAFTIDPKDFNFPTYSFSTPVPGTLQVSLKNPANGVFSSSTGALTMTADYVATINLTGLGSCSADTGPQNYSTSNTTVYPGVRFPATATGPVTGPGAFTGGWPTVQSSGSACGALASSLNGPGGLWISKNISPPALSIAASPKKASAKVGKPTTVRVTVGDTGDVAATGVSVCAKAPRAVRVSGPKCMRISSLHGRSKVTFKFKFKAKARGKFKLTFTASGTNVSAVSTTVPFKAKK